MKRRERIKREVGESEERKERGTSLWGGGEGGRKGGRRIGDEVM